MFRTPKTAPASVWTSARSAAISGTSRTPSRPSKLGEEEAASTAPRRRAGRLRKAGAQHQFREVARRAACACTVQRDRAANSPYAYLQPACQSCTRGRAAGRSIVGCDAAASCAHAGHLHHVHMHSQMFPMRQDLDNISLEERRRAVRCVSLGERARQVAQGTAAAAPKTRCNFIVCLSLGLLISHPLSSLEARDQLGSATRWLPFCARQVLDTRGSAYVGLTFTEINSNVWSSSDGRATSFGASPATPSYGATSLASALHGC
jgi:hypothetical protein